MAYNRAFPEAFGDIFVKVLDNLANEPEAFHSDLGKFVPLVKDLTNSGAFGAVDVIEYDTMISVVVDVPGTAKKDVQLELVKKSNQYVMKLTAVRKSNTSGGKGRFERFQGTKTREIVLPSDIDPNTIEAHHADGVLKVVIKRAKHDAPSKTIPIL